ncbi:hypothetical protein P0Y35_17095 [Kiritimatiellaeota bacterium B1221]|nr:hypothetical protein [Kiritimatiellaeota bacterium B1221]
MSVLEDIRKGCDKIWDAWIVWILAAILLTIFGGFILYMGAVELFDGFRSAYDGGWEYSPRWGYHYDGGMGMGLLLGLFLLAGALRVWVLLVFRFHKYLRRRRLDKS